MKYFETCCCLSHMFEVHSSPIIKCMLLFNLLQYSKHFMIIHLFKLVTSLYACRVYENIPAASTALTTCAKWKTFF